jgi:Icc protein
MKLLQITDTHLVAPGEQLYGLDPYARMEACVADIRANHADAEFCVITGDLAHRGERAAYEGMLRLLERLPMPWYPLLGNHDLRAPYDAVFKASPRDENGFVQAVIRNAKGHFIFLDTLSEGENGGRYCSARQAWLASRLEEARDQPVYLFMHHPPFGIGIPCLDRIALQDPEDFAALLQGYGNIRHLFYGHVHRPVCGSWRGIPCSTMRGLNHQVPFDLRTVSPVPKSHEPPAYAVVFIEDDQVIVHFHDFLDRRTLVKHADGYDYAR